jgi:hypothetical protein
MSRIRTKGGGNDDSESSISVNLRDWERHLQSSSFKKMDVATAATPKSKERVEK